MTDITDRLRLARTAFALGARPDHREVAVHPSKNFTYQLTRIHLALLRATFVDTGGSNARDAPADG